MKNKKSKWIHSLILASLVLGLLTIFMVPAYALEFSVQFGSPPPRPPASRFHARPEAVYVQHYNNAVLNLGCSYFSLDFPTVYAYGRDYNLTPEEVVYILYLSHYSHRSPTFVINVYKKYHNRGWNVMARQLGLSRGYPRWMRERNAPTLAVLYITSDYYDVPYSRIMRIYNQGYPPAEIVVAVNVSSRSGQPVGAILGQRTKGTKWEDISRTNKVSMEDIESPRRQGKSVRFDAPLNDDASNRGIGHENISMSKPGPDNEEQNLGRDNKNKNSSNDGSKDKDTKKQKGKDKGTY